MLKTLKVAIAIAALAFCADNASAQDCGCAGSAYAAPMMAYGQGGGCGYAAVNVGCGYCSGGMNNCGRVIGQGNAESLWGNYCNESCDDGGCKLFSRLKGRGGCGARGGNGGCGCDQGCFGYPAGGCGCGAAAGCGGAGLGGRFAGSFGHSRHGGCGGGNACGKSCGGKLFGGKGCGCKRKRGNSCDPCAAAPVGFGGGCDTCGCAGGSNDYFAQPVGYDYGTAGMHSIVHGSITGGCDGGCNGGGAMGHVAQPAQAAMQGMVAEPGAIPAAGN